MAVADSIVIGICRIFKQNEMRINKIIHRAGRPNDDGDWLVWASVYINGNYKFCALMYDTFEESKAVQEGQLLDIEKTRFSIRKFN